MDIAIVGAGIGGLTAAACLLQRGHTVRVYEQSSKLGEVGAGLQMSASIARKPSGERNTVSSGAHDAQTAPPARERYPTSASPAPHSTQLSRCGT